MLVKILIQLAYKYILAILMKKVDILPSHQLLWFLAKHLPRPGIRTPDLPVLSPKVLSIRLLQWYATN